MNLDQAQLERRSKELDAREAFIDAKEEILKKAPITLKVYDARVKASEDRLEDLKQEIKKGEDRYTTLSKKHTTLKEKLKQEHTSADHSLNLIKNEASDVENNLKILKKDLNSLEKQIKDRKSYLESQEKVIATTISDGNDTLLDLHDVISRKKGEVSTLQKESVQLKKEFDDTAVELQTREDRFVNSFNEAEQRKHIVEGELSTITKRVQEKSTEYKRIAEEVDSKMLILKEKESSLRAKRDQLILERQELKRDQSRWSSQKQLYDL